MQKQPHVLAVFAIPLALSACLTEPEPEPGPEPPEESTTEGVPERPLERVQLPPLRVEREYRVQAPPPVLTSGALSFGWDPIVKHSDTLAIAGDGDVHVIGDRTWYHFPALGGTPVATVVHAPGVFETPFAIAMNVPGDPDPNIAAHRGQHFHPAMRRFDSVTRNVTATCDDPALINNHNNWRFTRNDHGFWITGKAIVACDTDGNSRYVITRPREIQVRHPHAETTTPSVSTRSLEVSQELAEAFTELHLDSGATVGRTSLTIDPYVTTRSLWGAVEPGASTGYALVSDEVNPCPLTDQNCGQPRESRFAIVPVSMTTGAHLTRYTHPVQYPGDIIGGMLLIEPLSHDLYALITYEDPDQLVRTWIYQLDADADGVQLRDGKSIADAAVHDAIFVGEDLFISFRTAEGALLQVRGLHDLALRTEQPYGGPGDYPMALKRSFAGEPYYLIKEGNELVVRKLDLDTDGDGLLDRWETSGIDFNHDGEIDFALHTLPGISPLHKNIVFELDVANGAIDPRIYWLQIHQMFLAAPVTNPDGTTGIVATLLFSENFESPAQLDEQGELSYDVLLRGDLDDRNSENESAIFEAKRMATRHVVVFPYRRTRIREDGQEVSVFGRTYGSRGVASSFIAIYDDLGPAGTALYNVLPTAVQHNLRAGVLTHEIGHALGLMHGGTDDINYKPNYHSVMNGLHIMPRGWPVVPLELTFANTPGPTLVEDRLYESVGLGMNYTHDGHLVRYVTGPPGGPYHVKIGPETGPEFDFDGDGVIELGAVTADLTRDARITTLPAPADWPEMDWSLFRSPGWNLGNVVGDAADDEVEPLLAASGWCDPLAADGCTCPVDGQTRPCGTDVGVCTTGVQTCQNGFWGVCENSVPSMPERCDAADNDCDGPADENFPTLGQACAAGIGACTRNGTQVCTADELGATCSVVAGDPTTERCSNSVDDDCDGATDEGFPTIDEDCWVGLGVCRRDGSFVCGADGISVSCPATAGTPGAEVCNNGLDDDCDGATDEDCLATPLSPPAGHVTGSGRVVSAAGVYNPRQVTFRWAATTPGASYELQVDDLASFASPQIFSTSTPSYTTGDLFTAGSVPFGTRHHWRVRSRVGTGPWSAWSAASYVDVGRLPDDVNGDGFADVAVGATGMNNAVNGGGGVLLFHGRASGLPYGSPTTRVYEFGGQLNAHFGAAVTLADLDADGFSDLVVGIPERKVGSSSGVGQVAIYFGSAAGVPLQPSLTLAAPVTEAGASFGFAVASAGDVDGDGYVDLWVSAPEQDVMILWNNRFLVQPSVGAAYLYRGGPRATFSTTHATSRIGRAPYARFGSSMRSVGDVDDDGRTDMAFAAPGSGTVFVYRGGSTTLLVNLTQPNTVNFGRDLAAGDFDGDGGVDLAVTMTWPAGFSVFRKTGATLTTSPWYADIGGPSAWDAYVTSGDIDRDGDTDLALGYSTVSPGGRVVIYVGGANVYIPGFWTESQSYAELGRSLTFADTNGDGRADLFAGAPRANLTTWATREGKMLGWLMGATPAFGQAPTTVYDSPNNQAEGWFGMSME